MTFKCSVLRNTTLTGVGEIKPSFIIITRLGIKKQVECLHINEMSLQTAPWSYDKLAQQHSRLTPHVMKWNGETRVYGRV